MLLPIIDQLKSIGTRISLFVNADEKSIVEASDIGADRIELYTGPFAEEFVVNPDKAVRIYTETAKQAGEMGLEVNAGHDLNLDNLSFFKDHVSPLSEVSIGHALISDALYFGIEDTIKRYKNCL
jgi:pyridoxine 5-phosphate synthase